MLVNGETLSPPFSQTEWETKAEGPRFHSPRLPASCRVRCLVLSAQEGVCVWGGGGELWSQDFMSQRRTQAGDSMTRSSEALASPS